MSDDMNARNDARSDAKRANKQQRREGSYRVIIVSSWDRHDEIARVEFEEHSWVIGRPGRRDRHADPLEGLLLGVVVPIEEEVGQEDEYGVTATLIVGHGRKNALRKE